MSQSTLYINGIIYTMDEANICVSAMLVTDGRIAAIGSTDELLAIKPETTEIVDLNNQVMLPGLVDCHAHVGITGRRLFELELAGKSKEEILEAVKQRTSELQPGEWICGMGWNQENWEEKVFPTKEDLDAVAPDHPVKLTRYCGNAFWCNSLAIELAMNDTSHDVENTGTEFMLNDKGELAGILVGPACRKIDDVIPDYTPEQFTKMYQHMENICLSQGTTTIMEKGAGAMSPLSVEGSRNSIALLHQLCGNGQLKMRIHEAVIGLDPYCDECFAPFWTPYFYDDHLSVRSVKLWSDGAFGPHSAYLSEDYHDQPGHRGNRKFTNEELISLFRKFDDLGVQIEIHTIGDATTTQILDCYEQAFADSLNRDRRFIMDHVHVPQPEDIQRMAKLNIINSTQFIQFAADMDFLPVVLNPDMVKRVYPWRAVLDAGCTVVNGSDMDPVNPFLMMHVAVTRTNEQGVNTLESEPLQKLTRLEALRSCTSDAAYAMFMEDKLGSLEPGKHADFILIDRDYFTCPEDEIKDVTVTKTFIDGEMVFEQ